MKNETLKAYINTYPEEYFDLFGSEKDIDMEELKDINLNLDGTIEL